MMFGKKELLASLNNLKDQIQRLRKEQEQFKVLSDEIDELKREIALMKNKFLFEVGDKIDVTINVYSCGIPIGIKGTVVKRQTTYCVQESGSGSYCDNYYEVYNDKTKTLERFSEDMLTAESREKYKIE